jgi:hypothetical protein
MTILYHGKPCLLLCVKAYIPPPVDMPYLQHMERHVLRDVTFHTRVIYVKGISFLGK